MKVEHADGGIDFADGMLRLLDPRIAHDIFLFARGGEESMFLLNTLVAELEEVGWLLNAYKTRQKYVFTNEAQPPLFLVTGRQHKIQVKNGSGHKLFGCIFCAGPGGRTKLDLEYLFHAASSAFFYSSLNVRDRNVHLKGRLRLFDAVVNAVALFGSGYRCLHQTDLDKMDVACRRLLRIVPGPPGNVDWTRPWHDILHSWNEWVRTFALGSRAKLWSKRCLEHYWKLGLYVAISPFIVIRRFLAWLPSQ